MGFTVAYGDTLSPTGQYKVNYVCFKCHEEKGRGFKGCTDSHRTNMRRRLVIMPGRGGRNFFDEGKVIIPLGAKREIEPEDPLYETAQWQLESRPTETAKSVKESEADAAHEEWVRVNVTNRRP